MWHGMGFSEELILVMNRNALHSWISVALLYLDGQISLTQAGSMTKRMNHEQHLMAISRNARMVRNTGRRWSKPIAPPLHLISL